MGELRFDNMMALTAELEIHVPKGAEEALLRLLTEVPGSAEYVRVEVELPFSAPSSPSGLMEFLVPKTSIYFNLERAWDHWLDAVVAVFDYCSTQEIPWDTLVTVATTVYGNLSVLDDEEEIIVREFFAQKGQKAYLIPVPERDLRMALTNRLVSFNDVMERLVAKGIVEHNGATARLIF